MVLGEVGFGKGGMGKEDYGGALQRGSTLRN